MKFDEAIKELQEGKRIRQVFYADGIYLYMEKDGFICWNDGEKYRGMGGINLTDEWEVCGEEKRDMRIDVPNDIKRVYKTVGNYWGTDGYNAYGEYISQVEGENHLLKLWHQLCQMNEKYRLDE